MIIQYYRNVDDDDNDNHLLCLIPLCSGRRGNKANNLKATLPTKHTKTKWKKSQNQFTFDNSYKIVCLADVKLSNVKK